MSADAADDRMNVYGLLADPSGTRVVLTRAAGGGWTLPRLLMTDDDRTGPGAVSAQWQAAWGGKVSVLRRLARTPWRDGPRPATLVLALEGHDPGWVPPPGLTWAGVDALADLTPEHPLVDEAARTFWAEARTGDVPAARVPWARPGWLDGAQGWMAATLAARGTPLRGPITQVRTWALSCVLRGETDRGPVYFKACPTLPLFANEPAITAFLAARSPGHVPAPLAIAPEARWMLLAGFAGPLLSEAADPPWAAALAGYAALQRATERHIDALLTAGCLDRRPGRLAAAIPGLVAASAGLEGWSADEQARLAEAAPGLAAGCAALAAGPVAPALLHGDPGADNIALVDGRPVFFDWSDACVAHPFLDLPVWLDAETHAPAAMEALRETYLAAWGDRATPAALRAAAALGRRLGALHQAVSYQVLAESVEPAGRAGMVSGWRWGLRGVLETLGGGAEAAA